jgi:hypothetical protein
MRNDDRGTPSLLKRAVVTRPCWMAIAGMHMYMHFETALGKYTDLPWMPGLAGTNGRAQVKMHVSCLV